MTPKRIVLRAAALVVVGLALGGPTPGYVGNCSPGGGDDGTVDRVQFCTDKLTWQCARDLAAGRIDMNRYNTCVASILSDCAGFNFPSGCAPSHPLASACIDALSARDMINIPSDMIVQCQSTTLCGAALVSPEGI